MAEVQIGPRVPRSLAEELKSLCKRQGLVMNHLVTEAIREKLIELKEDEEDIATVAVRENEPDMSEKEFYARLKKRGL